MVFVFHTLFPTFLILCSCQSSVIKAHFALLVIPLWILALVISKVISDQIYLHNVKRRAKNLNALLVPPSNISGIRASVLIMRYIGRTFSNNLLLKLEPRLTQPYNAGIYNKKTTGPYSRIIITDPQIIKEIFSPQSFTKFGRGEDFKHAFRFLLGSGIFTNGPDQEWKYNRGLIKPFFSKERVNNVNVSHIDKIINKFLNHSKNSDPVDVSDSLSVMMFDLSLDYFFGFTYDESSQELRRKNLSAFSDATKNALYQCSVGPLGSLLEKIPKYSVQKSTQSLRELVNLMIENAKEDNAKESTSTKKKDKHEDDFNSFFHYLVTRTGDSKLLYDATLNLFFASRGTTAALMVSTLYEFSQHGALYKELREEIIRLFGKDSIPDNQRVLRDCKILHAVLKETLRMYPSAPTVTRHCLEDTVVTSQFNERYFIPRGSDLDMSISLMQRNRSLWGDNAEEWDPYRWLDSRYEKVKSNPSIYVPFSQGPRICPGQEQAIQIATVFLVRFCQTFENVERATDVQPNVLLTSTLGIVWKGGMWLRMAPPSYFIFLRQSYATSGVDLLPLMLGVVLSVIIGGQLISRIGRGRYYYFLIFGSILLAIGGGLLYTVSPNMSNSNVIGYQILCGVGVGLTMQNSLVAMQAEFKTEPRIIAQATGMVSFAQYFGGTMGLSVSEPAFSTQLTKNIAKYVPSATTAMIAVIKEDPVNIRSQLPSDLIPSVITAYVKSLDIVYVLGVVAGGCSLILAIFINNIPLRDPPKPADNGDNEKQPVAIDDEEPIEEKPHQRDGTQSSDSTIVNGKPVDVLQDKESNELKQTSNDAEEARQRSPIISSPENA